MNDDWDAAWDGDEPEQVETSHNGHGNGTMKNRRSLDEERQASEVSDHSISCPLVAIT